MTSKTTTLAHRKTAAPRRAVLVTGSSSGIGRAITLHLARRGFLVFATVRDPQTAKSFKNLGLKNLVPIAKVDLTAAKQVRMAADVVKRELRSRGSPGLYAIINNAGGGTIAPLELLDMRVMERELRTRIVGAASLVQALLAEVRKGGGRLLWITTPALLPLPYKSSIHISEFATHGLARTFGIELSPWNIPSVMIACGGVKSNALRRMDEQLSRNLKTWSKEQLALYGPALKEVLKRDAKIAKAGIDPRRVAETVEKALRAEEPKAMYRVGVSRVLSSMETLPAARVDAFFTSMKSDGT